MYRNPGQDRQHDVQRLSTVDTDAERYRLLFAYATDAILFCDPDGVILDANPAAERLSGYRKDELVGEKALELLVPPEWREVARARLAERLREQTEHRNAEVVLLDRSGLRRPAEASSTLVRVGGEVIGIASIVRDISERKRAEKELLESEERFRQAFEHAAIGMCICARSGQWLQVNRALCDIVGYSAEELLAMTFQDITHHDDLDVDLAYVRQLYAGEIRSYQIEKRYIHRDGHTIWVHLTGSVVHDADGTPIYALGQIQDITETKSRALRQQEATAEHRVKRPLSRRERQALALIADGFTSEEAASRLQIGAETIHTHIRRAMRKLDANTRTQAAVTATRLGLI